MKRRAFVGRSSGALAAVLTGSVGAAVPAIAAANRPLRNCAEETAKAVMSLDELQKLKKTYEHDLFEDFLPFMEKYVIDDEFGGFMCNTDRDGTNITKDKNTWFEGRGIWVYSYLYNNLAPEPKYLEVARKSVDFILRHKPEAENLWPGGFSQEGKVKAAPDSRGYGDLFVAGGLAEYARASGEKKYFEMAKDTLLKVLKLYDREDYESDAARTYLVPDVTFPRGARVLGMWMVLLNTASGMLDFVPDAEIKAVADRSLEAILKYHHNPDFDLTNEILNHDLSRPKDGLAQFVYTGHAIETMWMVMAEAVRRNDRELFDLAAARFRRHVDVAWDDVYGGAFRSLDHVDKNIWKVDKVVWLQEEVLIGSLLALEHTAAAWAREMFDRMFRYAREKFVLKQHGFFLWDYGTDRKATFERHATRVENFHHPRHLMLNLLSIKRMIQRKGRVSGLIS
ncbi:MAG: AGE family epimerase/isomerase [Acidobacteriota bacterium]